MCGRERKTNKRYKKKGDFVIIFVEKNGKNPGIKTHGGEFFFILLRAHSCDANASRRHLPHLSPIIDSARRSVVAAVVVVAASRIAYWKKSATERKA